MATKTDIELKIVDSVDTSHSNAEVLADSASNPDAFYVGRGYLAHNGEKVIEGIDENGTYPNVTVGNATDLTGRIEATSEVFTYRPSAGDKSIKDDNAFIRRVKGNSVVFNQILVPQSLTETSNGITVTQDGTGKVVVKGTATGRAQVSVGTAQIISGHKYIYFGLVGDGVNKFYWTDQTVSADTGKGVIAQPTYASGNRNFILNVLQGVTVDFTFYPQVSDLTAMFGTGNEPTTVDEFRALYPDSYYPYNPGELRNLVCSGIKTVGFNQWDEQWEIGYISTDGGTNGPSTTCIRSANFIKCLPDTEYSATKPTRGILIAFYDFSKQYIGNVSTQNLFTTPTNCAFIRFFVEYGTTVSTYNHDICINLHHTGYRDGEYEPYKEVTHALPLSQITNGEPLCKAGSVYDEINETEYIRRVGVRGYATGDKDDAALLTDGRYTNYPLDEPIVKPIETPIDFNYYVEDFGTEEALLADDSAPFSADIVYQFNAVDNIRQNRISIQKLNDIFSGSEGEYVRADGSWGYIADLKGNFFVKPTLKRIRTGISELSDTIQIIHPYLTEHVGDAKIVLMAVKRRGGSYYDRATNAKGRRKKRKAWGELHYAAMPNTEINHNTIEMPNGASFEEWQGAILTACGRIPEGLENAREPYNVSVALEDKADFFATNGAIFVGKTPVIRLGVALRIPNPNFIDYGNGNKMWDYNDVTGKWEYKYLYSDVAEVVVKSQMLRTGRYVLGLELV